MTEQSFRIGAFLSQYVNPAYDGQTLTDPAVQRDAITLLIEENVMKKEQIKREAVRDYDVIIPDCLFPEEADTCQS